VHPDTVQRRYDRISALADELCTQRAEERVGSIVEVLVDTVADGEIEGRAEHQAPEVDGSVSLVGNLDVKPGDLVRALVTATEGVDLIATPVDRG
jgi:tRNA A37 methylthiotransferase MiaB